MLLLQLFNLYFTVRIVNGFGVYLTTRESHFKITEDEGFHTSGLCLKLPFFEITIEIEDSD